MRLRLHTNQLRTRILGTLTGLGFLAVGAYAVFGADDSVAAALRERALWFGITALIGGAWAVAVSWLDSDLTGVWCRPPRMIPMPQRGATDRSSPCAASPSIWGRRSG